MTKEELIKDQFPNDEFLRAGVSMIVDKCVADLEKENAELKARLNAINLLTPELEKMSKLRKQQLTKAKEIIREYMRFEPMIGTCSFYSEEYEKTKTKAERFLDDSEDSLI